jgi:fatty-acyl-CoA synthase
LGHELQFSIDEFDWTKQWARYSPHQIAYRDADADVSWTWAEVYSLSCELSRELSERWGVSQGDRIALLATNELESIALFHACLRVGACLVPMNFRLAAPEIQHVLDDSEPTLLISQAQFTGVLAQVAAHAGPERRWEFESLQSFCRDHLVRFRARRGSENLHREAGTAVPTWHRPLQADPESPCMILYTSGTTGKPKGAMINPRMLFWNSLNTTLRLNLSQNDVFVSFLPFFHTGGWNVLLTPFAHRGARTVLVKKFDAEKILETSAREGATILFGVPTTMEMMAQTKAFREADLSRIRYAIVGGEPMPIELIRVWQERGIPIRQGFGLTEFGPNVFSLNEEDALRKIGSIGFPNFYIRTRVVDDHGLDVKPGEIGELILQGPMCMPGYWRNPKATAETIREGWLHTGDLVRVDEEGFFYVAGRKKDMFISGGENVYPVEIERVLSTHPDVREVAVIGFPDPKWGEVGCAYVSLHREVSSDELLKFCAQHLAKFKVPKHVRVLADLPKGDSGKLLKRALPKQL